MYQLYRFPRNSKKDVCAIATGVAFPKRYEQIELVDDRKTLLHKGNGECELSPFREPVLLPRGSKQSEKESNGDLGKKQRTDENWRQTPELGEKELKNERFSCSFEFPEKIVGNKSSH